ncbi:hypothetical protein [Defluviitalea phaphyphila]|uniref:hypothetical protein n=1 Tax=Defluviitalea phaphyphila TaxID=1473580 RepID=UPI00073146D9|nr:hypothetical protein [Defluviitalea phaphyphila]
MSNCGNTQFRGKILQRPTAGECPVCNPDDINPAEDACVCPPLGEPKLLTVAAPVVFDECGINLCRVVDDLNCVFPDVDFEDDDVAAIELKVIDIDFNFDKDDGSKVETLTRRPNCVRVTLENIDVTFAAKVLDSDCKVIDEECFTIKYLPGDADDPYFDDDTNPISVAVDVYAPYGVSYELKRDCTPIISFLGFVEDGCRKDSGNNSIRQGIVAQALAKVVNLDVDSQTAAIGLTIYLKAIYFVQYRIPHKGLCVPPKCIPVDVEAENACLEFVEGDLLEQSIQPLELCCKPKSFEHGCLPVQDPTPSEDCARKR